MKLHTGQQIITIHILPISQEEKATRQWSLVSYYNITREIFFFKNHAKNEGDRLVPDLFLFLKKDLYEVKASSLDLTFNIF